MIEFISGSSFFAVTLALVVYSFADLLQKNLQIGGVHAEQMPARLRKSLVVVGLLVVATGDPIGMILRQLFVKARRDISNGVDTNLVRRLDLSAEKIKIQVRVHKVCLTGMVRPAVMAFGKDRNGINVPLLEHCLELLLGKIGTDPIDQLAGMKVQMYLTKTHIQSSVVRPFRALVLMIILFYHKKREVSIN